MVSLSADWLKVIKLLGPVKIYSVATISRHDYSVAFQLPRIVSSGCFIRSTDDLFPDIWFAKAFLLLLP